MINLWPDTLIPYSLSRASVANKTPLPVAASLPRDPPRSWFENEKLELNSDFVYEHPPKFKLWTI